MNHVLDWPQRYWRGDVPQLATVLAVLLAGRGLVLWAYGLIGYPLGWATLIVLIGLDIGFLAWQLTGARRYLRQHQDGQSDTIAQWTCHGAMLIALFMAFNGVVTVISSNIPRPVPEVAQAPELERDGDTGILRGPIGWPEYRALQSALAGPGLTRLRLESPGGLIPAGRAMAKLVEEAGVSTEVEGLCASACVLVFLAGRPRYLAKGARLGFHGYRIEGRVITFDAGKEEARDRDWMMAQGLSEAFVTRVFQTPPEEMWFPDRATLIESGVLQSP